MRLIGSFQNETEGKKFTQYLEKNGILHHLEVIPERDWGNENYGNLNCRLWITDEDDIEKANLLLEQYRKNSDDPIYDTPKTPSITAKLFDWQLNEEQEHNLEKKPQLKNRRSSPITFFLLFLCTLIFFYGQMTTPKIDVIPTFVPYSAVLSPKIYKTLYYDYPKAYELIDKYGKIYGFESLNTPANLPPEAKYLLNEYFKTPYWKGFYPKLENMFADKASTTKDVEAPLFEKISEGEVWRLFTPALLHSDIFHILFNMLWLIALGSQMELRMSKWQFILLILIVAVVSNTAQYLMSGANFIGISGVLTGMLAYVWYRQRYMPWEGYQFLPSTFTIMAVFILGLAALQTGSFFTEIYFNTSFSPGFANTAHIVGAITGYVLARIPGFSNNL